MPMGQSGGPLGGGGGPGGGGFPDGPGGGPGGLSLDGGDEDGDGPGPIFVQNISRWWFQTCFIFTSTWGNVPI